MGSVFNPWEISTTSWIAGFFISRGLITLYDHLVIAVVKLTKQKLLPTRTTGTPVRYVDLRLVDVVYLFINAIQEWLFVQNMCFYIWHSNDVPKSVEQIGVFNTVCAVMVMFIVQDIFYAPTHRFLHWRPVYPYIHKHHHRQIFPVRGYLDAGNEHPVEHFIGTSCTWIAVYTAVHTTGAHAVIIFTFFNIHAALAMLNHSPYDVDINLIFMNYNVKAHEMHHRKFTTNYAQYWLGIDHLMGTYMEYDESTTTSSKTK